LEQRITNLTEGPLDVRWLQYGPGDLPLDRARYMDRRRFRFGYLLSPQADPKRLLVFSNDNDVLFERTSVEKRNKNAKELLEREQQLVEQAAEAIDPRLMEDLLAQRDQLLQERRELLTLWPNDPNRDNGYELSWFAATNRYFALAVHPLLGGQLRGTRAFGGVVARIEERPADWADKSSVIFTYLYSPRLRIAPGETADLSLGIYAGPLDRDILGEKEPFASLNMQALVLYQMSSWCAVCTFQWLAKGLLWFLSGVHGLLNDWGLAIIILVVVVRTLLHPLTKKAQVNMQRLGKAMSDLKPEIDKLQKKYPDQPKKLQQEQMKMMRERGVNPVQMLGCLPMFLQMPIWVALYAMLYFAIELRHEPAFWGFFQLFGNWPFLADLSAADHCFWEFEEPFHFLMWNMTGVNFLPVLMGLVFFFQQKYMSPPPSPSMTKEQIQQQKIMKVMMVVMFPLMLYSAPSGLTLYIFTSSLFGIIESRYIRKHIKEKDLTAPKKRAAATDLLARFQQKKGKSRDPQSRAFASAVERAKQKKKGPAKTYKKRR
ncbi:MAG: membrane protein insertase YidC, partial [Planctomycetota bacterium]